MEVRLVVAGAHHGVGGAELLDFGQSLLASGAGIGAAGCKGTALGQVGGVGHQALDGLKLVFAVVDVGQRVEQAGTNKTAEIEVYIAMRGMYDSITKYRRGL